VACQSLKSMVLTWVGRCDGVFQREEQHFSSFDSISTRIGKTERSEEHICFEACLPVLIFS
jgi:hypothetical protein